MIKISKVRIKELKCFIDGNALCIVNKDFEDLMKSEAVFIELNEKQIEEINKL